MARAAARDARPASTRSVSTPSALDRVRRSSSSTARDARPVTESLSAFVERGRPRWDELGALVEGAHGRVGRLPAPSVRILGRRYREAVADLAWPAAGSPTTPSPPRSTSWSAGPGRWSTAPDRAGVGGPLRHHRLLAPGARTAGLFLLIAALALFGPTLAIGGWAHGHPTEATRVAQVSPISPLNLADNGPRDPDTDKVTATGTNTGLSAQIFTNNARVALVAFAGGLTGGVLTLVSLIFNGLLLGLVGGLSINGGYGSDMFRLILPHGVLELSLITASGAAGFRTGWAHAAPRAPAPASRPWPPRAGPASRSPSDRPPCSCPPASSKASSRPGASPSPTPPRSASP